MTKSNAVLIAVSAMNLPLEANIQWLSEGLTESQYQCIGTQRAMLLTVTQIP